MSVPPAEQALTITLTADRPVAKPQEPGVFSVSVVDAAGAPVSAQVSLGVIDEAVYAIRPDDTPDPLRFFYRREYSRVGTAFSRDYYFTGFSGSERLQLAARKRRPFTLADFKGDKEVQPQVRKEFPDAIYWLGDARHRRAGAGQGLDQVSGCPDDVAPDGARRDADTKAGVAIARTTTTKDLIVRVITPRFLDRRRRGRAAHHRAQLPAGRDGHLGLDRGDGTRACLRCTSPTRGVIESGGERRDDWRLRATTVNRAVVTASARTGADSDAVELPIPVLPYGLRREVGRSGYAHRPMAGTTPRSRIPAASNPAARSVSVSLAPSMAGSLLGALDFLTSFPYGCTEQTLSSFLPNVIVTRTLAQLKLVPTERLSLLDRQVAAGLRRLADYQHDDGGWGWWKTDENHPFMTAYALFGLAEASRAGYQVEEYRLQNGARALATMYAEYPERRHPI